MTAPSATERTDVKFVADRAQRLAVIAEHPEAGIVTEGLPLRANLSVLENIALVPRYRRNLDETTSTGLAWRLLDRVGFTGCAMQRDPVGKLGVTVETVVPCHPPEQTHGVGHLTTVEQG